MNRVKSLEERIVERAEVSLRYAITQHTQNLRNLLRGDEGRRAVALPDGVTIMPLDDLLGLVENELYEATSVRVCNETLDGALTDLEHQLAYNHRQFASAPKAPGN